MALINYEKLQEYTSDFKTWIGNKFVKKEDIITGTQAEIAAKISAGTIPDGATVRITDDYEDGHVYMNAEDVSYSGTVSADDVKAAINALNSGKVGGTNVTSVEWNSNGYLVFTVNGNQKFKVTGTIL